MISMMHETRIRMDENDNDFVLQSTSLRLSRLFVSLNEKSNCLVSLTSSQLCRTGQSYTMPVLTIHAPQGNRKNFERGQVITR